MMITLDCGLVVGCWLLDVGGCSGWIFVIAAVAHSYRVTTTIVSEEPNPVVSGSHLVVHAQFTCVRFIYLCLHVYNYT